MMAKSINEPIPVILTGIGGGGHGEQILKALRLGEKKYRIIGTDINPACANRHDVDEFHLAPLARDEGYLAFLLELARAKKCIALFHGSEPEMLVMSKARDQLEADGLYVPVNPPSVMDICQDKVRTTQHLEKNGFAHPAFLKIASVNDLAKFDRFPAILKPSVGGGGSADVFIAQNPEELELFGAYLLKTHSAFVVQEYVGTPDDEYTVGVLFDRSGELLNSIAIKRTINSALTIRTRVPNRTGREELGKMLVVSSGISQGEVGDWPEIRAQCEAIAQSLNPSAPVNVQCRVVEGKVIPFEINPRFSGTTSLRAMAGYNEPDVLIRKDVLGEKIATRLPYRHITILRGLREVVMDAQKERSE